VGWIQIGHYIMLWIYLIVSKIIHDMVF
jgi:hypothetical protein